MRFAELDCVTVDAHGTLIGLADPRPELARRLRRHGLARSLGEIDAAFRTEIGHYRTRALDGCDSESVAQIRLECCEIFLEALGVDLRADAFLPDFLGSFHFRPEPGAVEVLADLRKRGLAIAVVSNWDYSLGETLGQLGLSGLIDLVVTSAEVGVREARSPHLPPRARDTRQRRRSGRFTSATRRATRPAPWRPGCSFAPAPLATAFEGWE